MDEKTPVEDGEPISSASTRSQELDHIPSESTRSRQLEPLRLSKSRQSIDYATHEDERPDLARLASLLSGYQSQRTATSDGLQRKDTVAGMTVDDPRFDPNHTSFNFYLWVRKFIQLLEEKDLRVRRSGFTFKNLNVSGVGAALQLQKNVGSVFAAPFRWRELFSHPPEKHILRGFNGHINPGELLIVLGRPGSGCSTFLKSICGELDGLEVSDQSTISYSGIPQDLFKKEFRGEVIYNQEQEKHFPHLTVGETLNFAAACRTPQHRIVDVSRKQWAEYMALAMMSVFGLSHTKNTKVGDDFVRGVSGGERKRVSIAEMALAGAPISAWDNVSSVASDRYSTKSTLVDSRAGCSHSTRLCAVSSHVSWQPPWALLNSDLFTALATSSGLHKRSQFIKPARPYTTFLTKRSCYTRAEKSTSDPQTKQETTSKPWAGSVRLGRRPAIFSPQ